VSKALGNASRNDGSFNTPNFYQSPGSFDARGGGLWGEPPM
jgi:hypothetical protein